MAAEARAEAEEAVDSDALTEGRLGREVPSAAVASAQVGVVALGRRGLSGAADFGEPGAAGAAGGIGPGGSSRGATEADAEEAARRPAGLPRPPACGVGGLHGSLATGVLKSPPFPLTQPEPSSSLSTKPNLIPPSRVSAP